MSKRAQRELIDRLRPLRRPWICAHGRPTMRYMMNFDNFKHEYALPSKVQVDKSKYCSLSPKFRQRHPQLLKKIGTFEQCQIDKRYAIYPSAELIEIKKQFLLMKQLQHETELLNECAGETIKETFKFTVVEDVKPKAPRKTKEKDAKPEKKKKEKKEEVDLESEAEEIGNLMVDNTEEVK